MDARNRSAIILALTVPLSSLLGLARAMEETGAGTFWDVWAANLWGDLVFTAGTVATGWAVTRLVAGTGSLQGKGALAVAVPASFLLHWAVYAFSWTLTGNAFGDGGEFFFIQVDGFLESWQFTWEWGWPGLAAMAFVSPALAWALKVRWAAPEPVRITAP